MKPWGRFATLALGLFALFAGQTVALAALTWWYQRPLSELPNLATDGVAVTFIIAISTPIEILLLVLFAQRTGESAAAYLGWVRPRVSHLIFGIAGIIAFIILGDGISWLAGRNVVTPFQSDIVRTASADGWLIWLMLAVIVMAPIGEETLFRGFLFRGWLKSPRDTWPTIGATALVFALMHVQYDWFVIGQVFAFGLLLGWMRWATGSSILTMLLHGLINCEGMLETLAGLHS